MLDAVLRRGEPMDSVGANATRALSPPDRGLAIAIATEVCRHLVDLDALIDSATPKPLPHDVKARTVLRIALVQTLVLGTPPHAAIATALPLVEGGPKRLVHGVFGTLMRGNARLPDLPTLPPATEQRWSGMWGEEMTHGAAAALAEAPPLELRLRDAAETGKWAQELQGFSLMPGHVRLPRSGDVTQLAGYTAGAWWVQDISASLPARLLSSGNGRRVLDVGAAPGGKTMQLAAAGWQVTALDASQRRLERLTRNLARTGLEAETLHGDGRSLPIEREWDAILIDAPCSATGIFRRHPDVLHRIDAADITNRAHYQALMLDAAAGSVAKGGTIVYAVCSLEREEGEDQIAAFLDRQTYWQLDPIAADEMPDGIAPSAEGFVRVMPPMLGAQGGADGFFMARLKNSI